MKSPSGKFVLRLPSTVHSHLIKQAKDEGISLNRLCLQLIEQGLLGQSTALDPIWMQPAMEVTAQLKHQFGRRLLGVLVFGSWVRDEATETSDLDILVILSPTVPIKRSLYTWWDDEVRWHGSIQEVNPQFVCLPGVWQEAGGIWWEVALNHHLLYEQGQKVSTLLKKMKQSIRSGRMKREISNGHPYWVREDT